MARSITTSGCFRIVSATLSAPRITSGEPSPCAKTLRPRCSRLAASTHWPVYCSRLASPSASTRHALSQRSRSKQRVRSASNRSRTRASHRRRNSAARRTDPPSRLPPGSHGTRCTTRTRDLEVGEGVWRRSNRPPWARVRSDADDCVMILAASALPSPPRVCSTASSRSCAGRQ